MKIKDIKKDVVKTEITKDVLKKLPEWFRDEKAVNNYIESVKGKKFYGAYDEDVAVGFICLKVNNQHTAEIYLMGILKNYHGQGIGRKLVSTAEKYLVENGYKFFMVKTLGESSNYKFYEGTRNFYSNVDFYPLE